MDDSLYMRLSEVVQNVESTGDHPRRVLVGYEDLKALLDWVKEENPLYFLSKKDQRVLFSLIFGEIPMKAYQEDHGPEYDLFISLDLIEVLKWRPGEKALILTPKGRRLSSTLMLKATGGEI